jgi:hypothetical protein
MVCQVWLNKPETFVFSKRVVVFRMVGRAETLHRSLILVTLDFRNKSQKCNVMAPFCHFLHSPTTKLVQSNFQWQLLCQLRL